MIAKAAPKRRSGRGSFTDLRFYLERDKDGKIRADLVGSWSGGVMSHATADLDMEHTAASGHVRDPVYHAILSWRPGEEVSLETARAAAEAVRYSIGAERHQCYVAVHRDESDARTHLHLMLNRVHPITLRGFDLWKNNAKLARAAEWVEREFGCLVDRRMDWREHTAEVDLGFSITAAEERFKQAVAERLRAEPPGAKQAEMDAVRRAGYSWATLLQREAIPAAHAAVQREGATWADLHAALETYGVHIERSGSGLRVVGSEPGQHLKASRLGLRFRDLQTKLGDYQESSLAVSDLTERLKKTVHVVAAASTWDELHENLAGISFAIERRGRGGRVRDLSGSGRRVSLGTIKASMPKLEKRLGAYELPRSLREESAREEKRRHAAIAERLGALAEDPATLLGRITAHHAVWTGSDVSLEAARVVGAANDELREKHAAATNTVVSATLRLSTIIHTREIRRCETDANGAENVTIVKEHVFSTPEVIARERDALDAVAALAQRSRVLELRAASEGLDEQQRGAYAYLTDGASDLRTCTGIAGAGKSRLLRDVCAAYSEGGYRVVGAAVAASAARVLGDEAGISAYTVARLIIELEKGRQTLGERCVIVVDEASMLATDDARALFVHARDAGARVLLSGDVRQHEAVGRGPVLAEIVERHGAYDLSETRRAQEPWLRAVGKDLREARTSRALDALRERGCIAEHATADDAMVALVGRYMADRRSEAGGEERAYDTAFGRRMFAIGERVVTRASDEATQTRYGDTWRVVAHRDDGRMELARERDGVLVVWDVREKPGVDHWQGLLIATRRADMGRLNELARKELRDKLGEERAYDTAFGRRVFAIGEHVVTRERHRASDTDNGDTWKVAAHRDDGRVELLRDRDEARVVWNVRENPAVDYGYATTSYRSQGRTVDGAYALASAAEGQRGMYVDVTRARASVVIAYGRDDLRDFGGLLDAVARNRGKLMVAAVKREAEGRRDVGVNVERSADPGNDRERKAEHRSESAQESGTRGGTEKKEPAAPVARVPAQAQPQRREDSRPTHADSAMESETLRVTSQGSGSAWGASGNQEAYVRAIKTSPLRYAWKVEQSGAGVFLRGVDSEIHDAGQEIVVRGKEAIAGRSAVDLAILKGWKRIDVDGGTEEMLHAVAIEAHERGLGVRADGRELTEAMIESYHEAHDREIKQTPKL